MRRKQPRAKWRAVAALLAAIAGLAVLVPAQPAGAFRTFGRYQYESWSYNESNIYATVGQAGIDSLYASDWAWEVESLGYWANPVACNSCTTNRNIYFQNYDGFQYGYWGMANGACGPTVNCWLFFDLLERWNTTWEIRNSDWMDFRTAALHELGHWIGIAHTYYDTPSTDPRKAVMNGEPYGGINYGEIIRDIRQDDINGFHGARNYATIISADDSFEYHGWFYWDFHFGVPGRGSGTLYCSGGYNSNCFIQYNGAGNSVYQDMHIRDTYIANGTRQMRGRVRFRNRTGAPAQATVAVWNLENSQVYAQATCNLMLDTSWMECATPYFTSDGRRMRLEAYNITGGNIDMDTAILG
jgi:hypothetical protein